MPYTDYPQAASDNAQRALDFREENGTDCGTPVGWARANQISSRYSSYATARQWGWLSVNDIRKFEGLDNIDNGDTYLQPLNMVDVATDNTDDD